MKCIVVSFWFCFCAFCGSADGGLFYMTASAADIPEPEGADYVDWSSVWNIELSYEGTAPVSTSFKNGLSLRCVRNK